MGGSAHFNEELVDLRLSVMRLLDHLESKLVQSRLAQLPWEQSARASHALASVHDSMRLLHIVARLSEPHEVDRPLREVQHHYGTILALIGSPEPKAAGHSRALRELNLRARQPGMRILYGVDVPRARALLVLGEHLCRNAYGATVRRALAVWRHYLSDEDALALDHTSGPGSL